MQDVITLNSTNEAIGLYVRKPTTGPELDLTDSFVNAYVANFKTDTTALAVFREPRLTTGFPDVVLVEYIPATFEKWAASRSKLKVTDLKVLQHLSGGIEQETETLLEQLGGTPPLMIKTLTNLLDSGLVNYKKNRWKIKAFNQIFGIKRLISVEAKMKDWKGVFTQAQANLWYASESYVLFPTLKLNTKAMAVAQNTGIGILNFNLGRILNIQPSKQLSLPRCYTSWLFNEWLGRVRNSNGNNLLGKPII